MRLGFPFRSYGHSFLYAQCPQTISFIIWIDIKQPVSSLLAPRSSLHILRSYGCGWSISFMSPFISPGGSPPRLGGLRCLAQFITFQICSLLISDHLASCTFVLPFAVQGLFSLMEKADMHGEGLRVYLLNITPGTSFLVSDSLGKQFCSIPPWYLFSAGKPELCQTLRKPVTLIKLICSRPASSVLAPTSPQLGPLHLVRRLCGFSFLPLGILPGTHSS